METTEISVIDGFLVLDVRCGYTCVDSLESLPGITEQAYLLDMELQDRFFMIVTGSDLVELRYNLFVAPTVDVAHMLEDRIMQRVLDARKESVYTSSLDHLKRMYAYLGCFKNHKNMVSIYKFASLFTKSKDDQNKIIDFIMKENIQLFLKGYLNMSNFYLHDFIALFWSVLDSPELNQAFGALKEHFSDDLDKSTIDSLKIVNYLSNFTEGTINNSYREKNLQFECSYDTFCNIIAGSVSIRDENERENYAATEAEEFEKPLSCYVVNSSHNSYLTGHQLTGKSSTEMYRQILNIGARLVELDCWDSKNEDHEPIVTHGHTLVSEVPFRECVAAIAENAFKTSDLPLLLSFENHCNARQVSKMTTILRELMDDLLLTEPLLEYPLDDGVLLPSPAELKNKIVIKAKKMSKHQQAAGGAEENGGYVRVRSLSSELKDSKYSFTEEPIQKIGSLTKTRSNAAASKAKPKTDKRVSYSELYGYNNMFSVSRLQVFHKLFFELDEDFTSLINYMEAINFKGVTTSQMNGKFYQVSSCKENAVIDYIKRYKNDFVRHTANSLLRVYPKGTRVGSDNFNPQVYWNYGCQLVSLNFQTLDKFMQYNLGFFLHAGNLGYVVKPQFLYDQGNRPIDMLSPGRSREMGRYAPHRKTKPVYLSLQFMEGIMFNDRRLPLVMEVDTFGMPCDTSVGKYKLKANYKVGSNFYCCQFDNQTIEIPSIAYPELAFLKITVSDGSAVYSGGYAAATSRQILIKVSELKSGLRLIPLRNLLNFPVIGQGGCDISMILVMVKIGHSTF